MDGAALSKFHPSTDIQSMSLWLGSCAIMLSVVEARWLSVEGLP